MLTLCPAFINLLDKDGKPTTEPNHQTDQNILVNMSPKFYGGLENSLSYSGIQLEMLFQFVKQIGSNFRFSAGSVTPGRFEKTVGGNQMANIIGRWQRAGDITTVQKYSTGTLAANTNNAENSDGQFSDASFIRLRNISLSWELPERWKRKISTVTWKLLFKLKTF